MDVDESISKYDEYHRGAEREVITVNTRIKPTNKGFELLAKLGWVEGQPLGLSGDGKNNFASGNFVWYSQWRSSRPRRSHPFLCEE